MPNDFLLQLFRALTPKDLPRLRKFLQSPYFNRRSDVLALYDYLLECRAGGFAGFDKRSAFGRIFPGEPYHNLRLNHVFTYLTRLVERYFTLEEVLADEPLLRLRHCRALRRRGVDQQFERDLQRLEREHRDSPYRNGAYYLYEYELTGERFAWEAMRTRAAHTRAPGAGLALANFFMLENLRWACTMQSARAVSVAGERYSLPLGAEVLAASAAIPEADMPALALLRHSLLTLQNNDDEEQFQHLRTLLLRYIHLLPPPEARDVFMAAINFAIRRHNRGEGAYTRAALELYREALERGVLADEGRLPKYTFINIFNLALLAGETEWARTFIDRYAALLPEPDRENTHRYCLAGLYFRQSEYTRVLELLQAVEFTEVFIHLDLRKMLLRSYFELGEWQALDSLLDSFRTYVLRQKDLGYHREGYLALIRFTKKLVQAGGLTPARQQIFAARIRSAKLVTERDWLLSKV